MLTDSIRFVEVISDDAGILTATPETVLSGNVFVGAAKKFQVGTIPVLDHHTNVQLVAGDTFDVLFGYNPSDYTITVAHLADQTPGNTGASHLLIGHSAWSNGTKIDGSMPNNGAVSIVIGAGETYTVPLGYHNGLGIVSAKSLAEQTMGTANASHILIGKRAWVNGKEIAGTMPNNAAENIYVGLGDEYIIPEGYHSGLGKIIVSPLEEQTQATAAENDIVVGKTAWVNGRLITGNVPKIASQEFELPINGEYVIPYGIHSGLGKVVQHIPMQETITVTPTFQEQTINVTGKYMMGNIRVTSIDAMNYKFYGEDSVAVIESNISTNIKTGAVDIEIGRIPVDNWHDQATNNVYNVKLVCKNVNSNTDLWSTEGMLYINNLGPAHHGCDYVSVLSNPAELSTGLKIVISQDEANHEHVFSLKGTTPTTMQSLVPNNSDIEFDIFVYNTFHTRRFGDDHDVD